MTQVLVVDGDASSRLRIEGELRRENFEIVAAPNGGSAWSVLQAPGAPRLVVLAWELPDVDGPDLVRRLRSCPGGMDSWVLMVSERDRREDRLAAFAAGANDYLVKPLDPEELRAHARSAARFVARIEDLERFERMIRRSAA